jgi:hypothetical protein
MTDCWRTVLALQCCREVGAVVKTGSCPCFWSPAGPSGATYKPAIPETLGSMSKHLLWSANPQRLGLQVLGCPHCPYLYRQMPL